MNRIICNLALTRFVLFTILYRLYQINTDIRRLNYYQALKNAQILIQTLSTPESMQEKRERIDCLITAWKALCRYTNIRYRRARNIAFRLRYEGEMASSQSTIEKALKLQLAVGEESAACQTGLYLAQQWRKRWETRKKRSLSPLTSRQ